MQLKTFIVAGLSVLFSQGARADKCGGGFDLAPEANLGVGHATKSTCPEGESLQKRERRRT